MSQQSPHIFSSVWSHQRQQLGNNFCSLKDCWVTGTSALIYVFTSGIYQFHGTSYDHTKFLVLKQSFYFVHDFMCFMSEAYSALGRVEIGANFCIVDILG